METGKILLTTGLACLIAAIIGGGLKAFNVEIPLLSSIKRQIVLGIFGLILVLISFAVPNNPENSNASNNPSQNDQVPDRDIKVNSHLDELKDETNPSDLTQDYNLWKFSVYIENKCSEPIFINDDSFFLYFAKKSLFNQDDDPIKLSTDSTKGSGAHRIAKKMMKHRSNHGDIFIKQGIYYYTSKEFEKKEGISIESKWLQPNQTISGSIAFLIPGIKLKDGSPPDSNYYFLRFYSRSNCPVVLVGDY